MAGQALPAGATSGAGSHSCPPLGIWWDRGQAKRSCCRQARAARRLEAHGYANPAAASRPGPPGGAGALATC